MASDQFTVGKMARLHGRPREITDGRLTIGSRQEWYRGWDVQNEAMRPAPTAEQRAQHNAFCEDLLKRLAES